MIRELSVPGISGYDRRRKSRGMCWAVVGSGECVAGCLPVVPPMEEEQEQEQ